jgi:hypothetical protein
MFVPTFDNDVSILVNHSFDLTVIIRFDTLLLCENKLCTVPLELGHATIALYVDVQWLMFLTIEEERESKESEYFWHNLLVLLFICHKDRNYF